MGTGRWCELRLGERVDPCSALVVYPLTRMMRGTKALEKRPKGFSHCLKPGGRPGVLLDFREEIVTKVLP